MTDAEAAYEAAKAAVAAAWGEVHSTRPDFEQRHAEYVAAAKASDLARVRLALTNARAAGPDIATAIAAFLRTFDAEEGGYAGEVDYGDPRWFPHELADVVEAAQ